MPTIVDRYIAAHLREVMGGRRWTVQGWTAAYYLPIEFNAVDVIELSPDVSAIIHLETWYDTASAIMDDS